jgi:hypothetical protein
MASETKSTGAVALAFAAALLSAPVITNAKADVPQDELQPSTAALQHLEQTASTMIWRLPIPPRWIELWPEVTHVESIPPTSP